jgi:hypothetical protein
MRHTLRGGNKEADQLANEAMDKGMGRKPAPPQGPASGGSAPDRPLQARKLASSDAPNRILEGYVKNGVVHLLGGELPDGTFVKVIKE